MATENILTLTDSNFDSEVTKSAAPVLVDFWTEWCGPCKMLAPILEDLASEYNGKVKIGKVNAEEQQALAAKHNIRAFPTMLVFKGGEVVDQVIGLKSKKDLKLRLDRVLTG